MKLFGIEFGENKVYEVKSRGIDYKAPDSTITETHRVAFLPIENQQLSPGKQPIGAFMNGLKTNDPCYGQMKTPPHKVKEIVDFLQEFIVKRYRDMYGVDIMNWGYEEWKGHTYEVYEGKIFRLSEPSQAFELWLALLNGVIVTETNKFNPITAMSPYYLKDEADKEDEEMVLLERKDNTRDYLRTSAKSDFESYLTIMKYLGIYSAAVSVDRQLIAKKVLMIMEGKDARIGTMKLVEAVEKYNTTEGKEEIEAIVRVHDMVSYGLLKVVNGNYMFGDVHMGYSISDVMRKLSGADKKVEPYIIQELLEGYQAKRIKYEENKESQI